MTKLFYGMFQFQKFKKGNFVSKFAWLMALLTFTFASNSWAQVRNQSTVVFPRGMQKVPTITLNELIYQSIPRDGRIDWDALQIPSVQWISSGVEENSAGHSVRYGLVRVRTGGPMAKVLRRSWEELSWSVTIWKYRDTALAEGASEISIQPGIEFQDYGMGCFGLLFQGCDFPSNALKGPKHSLALVCSLGGEDNGEDVFRATTADGRVGTVVWQKNSGSGGYSTSLKVLSKAAKKYCIESKNQWQ
jgi:hypothetical protein